MSALLFLLYYYAVVIARASPFENEFLLTAENVRDKLLQNHLPFSRGEIHLFVSVLFISELSIVITDVFFSGPSCKTMNYHSGWTVYPTSYLQPIPKCHDLREDRHTFRLCVCSFTILDLMINGYDIGGGHPVVVITLIINSSIIIIIILVGVFFGVILSSHSYRYQSSMSHRVILLIVPLPFGKGEGSPIQTLITRTWSFLWMKACA